MGLDATYPGLRIPSWCRIPQHHLLLGSVKKDICGGGLHTWDLSDSVPAWQPAA